MKLALQIWILLKLTSVAPIRGAVAPPPWADPKLNPCAKEPRGWQLLYWPPDGKCYTIFRVGHPCPEGMELSPATSRFGKELYAECRCPPKHALSTEDGKCYQLFTIGPCHKGFYFGPDDLYTNNITTSHQQLGSCKEIPTCPDSNSIYWIKGQKCHQKLTKGPCPKGQLLTTDENGISICDCNKLKDMRALRAKDDKCYQHFTKGPCKEKGHLFLPDQTCGCWSFLPHYYPSTQKCYELGTAGPCSKGEMFTVLPKTSTGGCMCRPGNVRYLNNTSCHRPFTRGPCPPNHILLNATTCIPQPCRRGHLYHPSDTTCYKVGTRGPCPSGKIVSFDFDARPSVDGPSFNAVCLCEKTSCETENRIECEKSKGLIRYGQKCFKVYSQGPCQKGAWIVPKRQGKELLVDDQDDQDENGGECECVPGHVRRARTIGRSAITDCLPQAEIIAEYLNDNYMKMQVVK